MKNPALFEPLELGSLTLPNRILMAPLTRARADEGHVPNDMMAQHYSDRASSGLLIAEATMAMEGNCAFVSEPGIYNNDQVAGWKKVTDAVHENGGRIFLQIWHGGRACHSLLNNGRQPVAPSPIAITNDEVHTPEGKKAYEVPRELDDTELPAIVEGFRKAAWNAKSAGFDGIEIHGANGYLLDSFLRDSANQRSGPYGGSFENRSRLLLEVIDAVSTVWKSDQVGVRISPLNSFNSMRDSDPVGLYTYLSEKLNARNLAYLHLMRADFLGEQEADVITPIRAAYQGTLITNMGYSADEAAQEINAGHIDAVAFGTPYLANPDLPERFAHGAELNEPNPETFYSPGPEGYNDYPTLGD
ncbi:alkene reductase [Akkermansiaceae bacterium]|nr:alkene reductase [Akkermansiaceae bacterium]MDB4809542.1 alkene reductase [bacterium]MDA7907926.1 alkene reductase [Akkermansiaceae bacterium]MDA9829785.1 alkene reductase [Akkermansiaceae bacterium]MDB4464745.1 alkene reductase [Akkermansiaceae bacterium]